MAELISLSQLDQLITQFQHTHDAQLFDDEEAEASALLLNMQLLVLDDDQTDLQTVAQVPERTFYKFMLLPEELRMIIWEYAIADWAKRRKVRYRWNRHKNEYRLLAKVPPMLQACKEVRKK